MCAQRTTPILKRDWLPWLCSHFLERAISARYVRVNVSFVRYTGPRTDTRFDIYSTHFTKEPHDFFFRAIDPDGLE
jgi:hypothetical protein